MQYSIKMFQIESNDNILKKYIYICIGLCEKMWKKEKVDYLDFVLGI